MFFSSNPKQATVNFTLKPIAINANVKRFMLNLDGQLLMLDQSNNSQPSLLQWTLKPNSQATISFIGASNKIISDKQTGPWAWLRLLAGAKITPTTNKSFDITFSIKNADVEYQLSTPLSFNPFYLGKLSDFTLPKTIFQTVTSPPIN